MVHGRRFSDAPGATPPIPGRARANVPDSRIRLRQRPEFPDHPGTTSPIPGPVRVREAPRRLPQPRVRAGADAVSFSSK